MNNTPVELPDKQSFKPAEVCDIVQIPAYVLRTWENEFKDLGVARAGGGARTYRRRDVELALRIKELVFSEHLTLAGVRRRLEQEHLLEPPAQESLPDPDAAEAIAVSAPVKSALQQVKSELRALLAQLGSGTESSPANVTPISDAPPSDIRPAPGRPEDNPSLPGFDAPSGSPELHAAGLDDAAAEPPAVKPERKSRRKK